MSKELEIEIPVSSTEIKNTDVFPFRVGEADVCFWLQTIAYQLAKMNERER